AIIVNRRWDLVTANSAAIGILSEGVSAELLTPPINTYRVSLHPDGLAPRILNFAEWSSHLLTRLHRQTILSSDPDLADLHDELSRYPGVERAAPGSADPADMLFVPFRIRQSAGPDLTFFSTVATFGTA